MTDDPILHALLDLCQAVGAHQDAMFESGPLHAPFCKAVAVVRAHVKPGGELVDVTEILIGRPIDRSHVASS